MARRLEATLDLSADDETSVLYIEDTDRVSVHIAVADATDAVGTFYLSSRVKDGGTWTRHPTHLAAKTTGNGLLARFDWGDRCGRDCRVEWDRTSGGAAQTAAVVIQAG